MIQVEYVIDLISSANRPGKVRDKIRRQKRHRETAYDHLFAKSREPGVVMPKPPYLVTLTRINNRLIRDEEDNLRYAFKQTKDGVAKFLGMDDATGPMLKWCFLQEQRPKKDLRIFLPDHSLVRIKIEHLEDHQGEHKP